MNEEIEFIAPDATMMEHIGQIIEQNATILKMNHDLMRTLLNPPIVATGLDLQEISHRMEM